MSDFSEWDHEGFDLEGFIERFREDMDDRWTDDTKNDWNIDGLEELYNFLEEYYGEDWLLEIDFDDEDFWDLFRELYDHAA